MNDSTDFAVFGAALLILLLFISWFTGSLRQNPIDKELKRTGDRLHRMVGYSYAIAFGALLFTVYPFFSSFNGNTALQEGAFTIVRGCVEPSENQQIAPLQSCKANHYQWLLSIGAAMARGAPPASSGENVPASAKTDESQNSDVKPTDEKPDLHFILYGGLTVPLYLVVISLLGGAVSMTRRVPEIQRLAWAYILREDQRRNPDAYHGQDVYDIVHKDERPMPPETAREHFIFQIMQLISAPVIAVVVFELLSPSSVALVVGIAFVSGFTSEQVLKAIRNAAGRFIAKTSPPADARPDKNAAASKSPTLKSPPSPSGAQT